MRILIIHQYYLGESDSGGSRFNQFAKYWAAQGHQVTVLAGTVNYVTGKKSERYRSRWITEEHDENGVRVLRCYEPQSYGSYLRRLFAYCSFSISATWAGLFRAGKHDAIIASSPPLLVGIPAYFISRLRRTSMVFEVRDLWPQFPVEAGGLNNRWGIRLARWLERTLYRKAHRINVVTPAFRDVLFANGVPEEKLAVIPNGADLDLFQAKDPDEGVRRRYGWGDKFVVLYTGAHGRANALEQVLEAAEQLLDRPDILFALVGDGMDKPRLEARASAQGITNVQFIDAQPKSRMPEITSAADVGLAVLKRLDGFKGVYPNKLFDYMACARPVIVAIDGVARKLVEEAQAGIYVEPEDPAQLRDAVLALYTDRDRARRYGESGYAFVRDRFSREHLADQYLELLHGLLKRKKSHAVG